MIPKIFTKEHGYAPFPPFGIPAVIPQGLVRADLMPDPQVLPPNANIETILQNHRRKMLRRAANRRSAQLSRARKKAHLEDLKTENSRLQRLVDVLDSQPELVFCVTPSGKITYVSERTMNFIKVNFAGEDSDSDDDPSHINQILAKESVNEVLDTIAKLREYSINRSENDLNMLFSVKVVNFHDAVGQPIVGYLRCSKVHRRTSMQDLQNTENLEKTQQQGPPTKKLKTSKNSAAAVPSSSSANVPSTMNPPPGQPPNWNLANFKLLADCVSSLTEEKALGISTPTSSNDTTANASNDSQKDVNVKTSSSNGGGSSKKSSSTSLASITTSSHKSKSELEAPSPPPADAEEEFVCVIRTGEDCFVPYRSNKDVLMFASALSAASIEAHDLELRTTAITPTDRPNRMGSPSESNNSNNSIDVKTTSDSSNKMKNSTSSETGSEDNNAELDSN